MLRTMRFTYYATTLLFVLAFTQVAAQAVIVPFQKCSLWTNSHIDTINLALGASLTVVPTAITSAQTTTLKTFLANYMWMVNRPAYDAVHSGDCGELGRQVWKRLGYTADFDPSHVGSAPDGAHFNEIKVTSPASSLKPGGFVALSSIGAFAHLASKL